ncbi:protein FAM151B [Mixophyes fleayi]|uniref:protein FAM151B n=1 Tax=Mixophyes fleayi TaxID=3061075 RepID=UPI003F4DB598
MRKSLTCIKSCLCITCIVIIAGALIKCYQLCCADPTGITMDKKHGPWNENILDYFLSKGLIEARDGIEIMWDHAVNSQEKLHQALHSDVHMIEADVLLRGSADKEPIMAHPPATDSDLNLKDWLAAVSASKKGIKLDFKSLEALLPSLKILDMIKHKIQQPVWINADILPGPGGNAKAVDSRDFLQTVTSYFPDVTLSLGWTTGWRPEENNEGYSWEMVREMEEICKTLSQPVTFPVRAALVRQSWPPLQWLLQTSDRYSLTVWAGKDDLYPVDDLLYIREHSEKHRVFYDVFEPQNNEFKKAVQQKQASRQ